MGNTLICLFVTLAAGDSLAQESLRPDRSVAFVGGMLLDGYEAEPMHHSVVIFENGRITAVGSKLDTEIPDNAVIIDTGGKTVMPGLIDAHMHIDLIGHGEYERYYAFLNNMERIDEVMLIAAKQMMRGGVSSGLYLGAPFQILAFHERIRAGEILDQFDELGALEPGKFADIIVIDGNPLANIDAMQHVGIVVKDGGIWYAESAAYGPVTEVGHAF
jgi:imidazolonepropionase-like amidohydrolase